jgi:phosphotransferase system HPr (HPr) family protein
MSRKSATRKVTVVNPPGLHARPSLAVVQTVRRFKSKVEVRAKGRTVDAGQILELMSLGAEQGDELLLTATGPDAAEVLDALARQFADGFGLLGEY